MEHATELDPLLARADAAIARAAELQAETLRLRSGHQERSARLAWWLPGGIQQRPAPAASTPPATSRSLPAPPRAGAIRRADGDIERAWKRVLPTIETPLDLVRR